jgi:cell division protein FtsB
VTAPRRSRGTGTGPAPEQGPPRRHETSGAGRRATLANGARERQEAGPRVSAETRRNEPANARRAGQPRQPGVATAEIHALAEARRRRAARHRRRVRLLLIAVATALLANALVGDNGLLALWRARRECASLRAEVERLRAERDRLRAHARRLREDPAAIEEVARRELGLLRRGERLVVLVPPAAEKVR